jgi:nitrate/nitrite transporter NarK
MNSENIISPPRPLITHLISIGLVALTISANFTNYGGIQAALQDDLHITNESIGLLSTLLYLGIACGYVVGGGLVDRFGPRKVLIAALLTMGLGNAELAIMPHLNCVLVCRFLIGVGAGIGIVAGSQTAARLPGRAASVGQGLFGGAMQVGSGLGLFASPLLLPYLGWEGIFAFWGGLALLLAWQWTIWKEALEATPPPSQKPFWQRFLKAARQPRLIALGAVHLGTLGMGQAIAPWLAVFFASSPFILPISLAAGLGASGLLLGAITRPMGGLLLTRRAWRSHLLRLSGLLAWIGLLIVVLCPTVLQLLFAGQAPLIAHVSISLLGLLLAVAGWTLPYSSVFTRADQIGQQHALGRGTAQSVAMLLSAPASALGPVLIGWLHTHANFPSIFALICWIQLGVLLLAWLLELSPSRPSIRSRQTQHAGRPEQPYIQQIETSAS